MHYPDLETLTPDLRQIIADKRGANVYKMLMHSPNVAPGFTAMADAVMWSKAWPATWREMAIVRVGHHYKSPYEIHHHEAIGAMVGVSREKLAACAIGADTDVLDQDDLAILHLTDALLERHTLSGSEREQGLRLLGANGLADFVLTVGFYQLVSNFLNTFKVQIEANGLDPAPTQTRPAQVST